jgi:hypothetical protein
MMTMMVMFKTVSKYPVSDTGLILLEDRRGPRALNLATHGVTIKESQRTQSAYNGTFCGCIAVFVLCNKHR